MGAEILISSLDTAILTGKADKSVSLDWLRAVNSNLWMRNNSLGFGFVFFQAVQALR